MSSMLIADIVAGAPVGQAGGDGSHTSNDVIEAALVHGTSNGQYRSRRTSYN